MMRRSKEGGPPQRPETPWWAAAMLGLTISAMAGGAIMLGAGLAIGQSVTPHK
jgi:hypothetical protein